MSKCTCGKMDLVIETQDDLNIQDKKAHNGAILVKVGKVNEIVCDSCDDVVQEKVEVDHTMVFEADSIYDSTYSFEEIIDEL